MTFLISMCNAHGKAIKTVTNVHMQITIVLSELAALKSELNPKKFLSNVCGTVKGIIHWCSCYLTKLLMPNAEFYCLHLDCLRSV